jgi:uncharacterized protein YukE
MSGFHVRPHQLDASATSISAHARAIKAQATKLEGECESTPKVGDVQAAALFQQDHYDWTQTRFEDLIASEEALSTFARNLHATADDFRTTDAQVAEAMGVLLGRLDAPVKGAPRPR